MARIKSRAAQLAAEGLSCAALPEVLVTLGAMPHPAGLSFCQLAAVDSLVPVAQTGSPFAPLDPVPGRLTGECVRDLMQEHLLDLRLGAHLNEVTA